jgi:multiple sugar transport system substrate-binding protein
MARNRWNTQGAYPQDEGAGGTTALTRRQGLAIAFGTSAALVLAACRPTRPQEGPPDLSKINRRLLVWSSRSTAVEAQVARWSEQHPNLPADLSDIGSAGQGRDALSKFLVAVASGDVADVVLFDRFQIGSYAYRGAFTPLDTYQKADKYDLTRFIPAALDEAYGLDKRLYGLPQSTDNRPFFWNKRHLPEINADPEKPPATWDQLKEYALKLTRMSAGKLVRIGWTYRHAGGLSGSSLTYLWGFLNGAEFLSPDGRRAQLNHPKVIEAMPWVLELLEAQGGLEQFEEFSRSLGSNELHPLLVEQASMVVAGHGLLRTIAQWKPDFEFGIGPNPVPRPGMQSVTWSGGFAWTIPKGVKNPEISWIMIKDLVGEASILYGYEAAAQQVRSQGQLYIPPMSAQPAIDRIAFDRFKTGVPSIDKGLLWAVDYMKFSRFRPISPAAVEMYDMANVAWNEVLTRKKSVKQAYDDANAVAQAALDEAYAAGGGK